MALKFWIYSVSAPGFFMPPVKNYMLYGTLICKKIAREPGRVKNISLLSLGGGEGAGGRQNRSELLLFLWLQVTSSGGTLSDLLKTINLAMRTMFSRRN